MAAIVQRFQKRQDAFNAMMLEHQLFNGERAPLALGVGPDLTRPMYIAAVQMFTYWPHGCAKDGAPIREYLFEAA